MPWTSGHVRHRYIIRVAAVIALSSSCMLMGAHAARAASATFTEPIFGLSVERGKGVFETLPAAIAARCAGLGKGLGGTNLVFAHVKDPAGDAYILLANPGTDPNGEGIGVTVRLDKSGCTAEESIWTLSGRAPADGYGATKAAYSLPGREAPKLCEAGTCHYLFRSPEEERMLKALLDDAIARAVRGWGGIAHFKDEACTPRIMRNNEDYPAVRARLSQLCGF